MPKIDLSKTPVTQGSDYPAPLHLEFADRIRRRLGDAVGFQNLGINLTTLPPGGRSSLRHWHEVEEEMVFVLSGTLTLIDDHGEVEVGPHEAAGFAAGDANAHHFVNRGSEEVVLLEVGTRPAQDRCHYAEHDLIANDDNGNSWYTTRDGAPITKAKERFA